MGPWRGLRVSPQDRIWKNRWILTPAEPFAVLVLVLFLGVPPKPPASLRSRGCTPYVQDLAVRHGRDPLGVRGGGAPGRFCFWWGRAAVLSNEGLASGLGATGKDFQEATEYCTDLLSLTSQSNAIIQ